MMNRNARLLLSTATLLAVGLSCSFVEGVFNGDDPAEESASIEFSPATESSQEEVPDKSQQQAEVEPSPPGPEESPPDTAEVQDEAEESPSDGGGYQTIFPLPADVQNFVELGEDSINFQTGLSIEEVIDFYRQAFQEENLSERTLNTSITDTAFSMVFDGHPNGTIVIQGVDLGNGTTNINLRFEDV